MLIMPNVRCTSGIPLKKTAPVNGWPPAVIYELWPPEYVVFGRTIL